MITLIIALVMVGLGLFNMPSFNITGLALLLGGGVVGGFYLFPYLPLNVRQFVNKRSQ